MGRAILIAVAILTLVGSFLFLGPFIAIPTFLVFGLALPIYFGWKRPRGLAIAGLVVLLVAAPIAALGEAQLLRAPAPAVSSPTFPPWGNGGAVLQNAHVNPYTGSAGGQFVFSVDVHPNFVPVNDSHLMYLVLYVTTCPGATGNASPSCNAGYPFYTQNHTFPANTTASQTITFTQRLPGANVWWWTTAASVTNASGKLVWIFLNPQNGFGSVQGPVSGDFFSTVGLVIPAIYASMFLYAGVVFYFALLIYMYFKARERRRKARDQASRTGSAPSPSADQPSPSATTPALPKVEERTCPNCSAVVYPKETNCWKCGAALNATPAESPLPSAH